jgi:hypothetical protein
MGEARGSPAMKAKPNPPRCKKLLRNGAPCQASAVKDGLCSGHAEQREAAAAENQARTARGEPPMDSLEEDRWLKARRKARRQQTSILGISGK